VIGEKVLIDGDILAYWSACYAEDKSKENVHNKVNDLLADIISNTWSTDFQIYLTGMGNFRKDFAVTYEYKGNRKDKKKPKWLGQARDYMIRKHGAIVSHHEEADDLIAIAAADHDYDNVIVASVDKDFLQLPCWFYNIKKRTFERPTPEEALKNFYLQTLTGDRADNIMGLKGVGPVKANKILEGLTTEEDLYRMCLLAYQAHDMTEARLIENARLLYLRRKVGETWEPPF